MLLLTPARVDLLQPVGSGVVYDTLTPNRIADRTSRTTETSRSNRRPKRSRHAPRMRASDIRPHRPSRRTSPGSPSPLPSSLRPSPLPPQEISPRGVHFTDPAMMHRETIDMERRGRDRQVRGRGGPHLRRMCDRYEMHLSKIAASDCSMDSFLPLIAEYKSLQIVFFFSFFFLL